MNPTAVILASGIALAALVTPASAIAQGRGGSATPARMSSVSSQRPTAPARTTSRTPTNNSRQHAGRDDGARHRNGDWRNNHYRPRYVNNYYFGRYPYFGSPFGYGYGGYGYGGYGYGGYGYGGYGYGGYGYGYGYPSLGVSFYSGGNTGGYRPYYGGTTYQGGGGSVVSQVQQRLAQAGYYRGAIDGVIGDRTRSAIRAYERASGLPVDGRIDQNLLARLRVS